jgi:hypothetical protein
MSSVITGLCAWMTGKGDQIGSDRPEEDINVLLEDVVGVRRGRGAGLCGLEAI